jgi:hypothetical protein
MGPASSNAISGQGILEWYSLMLNLNGKEGIKKVHEEGKKFKKSLLSQRRRRKGSRVDLAVAKKFHRK